MNIKKLFNYFLMISLISVVIAQSNYSLEDINPSSPTFGIDIGPSYFENQVTIHYFGHYN